MIFLCPSRIQVSNSLDCQLQSCLLTCLIHCWSSVVIECTQSQINCTWIAIADDMYCAECALCCSWPGGFSATAKISCKFTMTSRWQPADLISWTADVSAGAVYLIKDVHSLVLKDVWRIFCGLVCDYSIINCLVCDYSIINCLCSSQFTFEASIKTGHVTVSPLHVRERRVASS